MPAAMIAQTTEVAQATGIPILVLVTGFISALLILAGWVLSLERRKVDRREFEMYSSKLESRLQAMQTDLTTRIIRVSEMVQEVRSELLGEIRELRKSIDARRGEHESS